MVKCEEAKEGEREGNTEELTALIPRSRNNSINRLAPAQPFAPRLAGVPRKHRRGHDRAGVAGAADGHVGRGDALKGDAGVADGRDGEDGGTAGDCGDGGGGCGALGVA